MPEKIFLSHTSDDQDLVDRISRALEVVDVETVAYEREESRDDEEDRDAIRRLMRECTGCFVFPTEAARSSEITSSWLVAESSIAEDQNLPVIIFKENDAAYEINFPYFSALVTYDPVNLALQIQERIQDIQELDAETEAGIAGGILGGLVTGGVGGVILGAILLAAAAEEEDESGAVRCPRCEMQFGYIGESDTFQCPHCHTHMNREEDSIGE